MSYTIRRYFFSDKESRSGIKSLLLFMDIAFVFIINYYSRSYVSLVLYIFLIDDVILTFRKIEKYIYIPIIYFSNIASALLILNTKYDIFFIFVLGTIPVYIIFCIIFFLINYLLKQNEIIEKSLKEVTIKKLEKDAIYSDLDSAYKKVEIMTASNERNKIAREIHDIVGHTLTTVLVELEAAKRLIDKDKTLSMEKLSLAQEQVRKGLNDIRSSVRLLEKGQEIIDFYSALEALISDVQIHSEVVVRSYIEREIELNDKMKRVIYRCLQEGLTNGIRHGKSTAFLFKLYCKDNYLYFSLEDNGVGAAAITPGFGIRAMKERVKELKGTLNTESVDGEGLSLYIKLPLEGGQVT
jgi:signal transduction histidine kinase